MNPLWTAVHNLRTAEALAELGTVSGPADAPPSSPDEEQSWTEDWIRRGKEALEKARAMHDRGSDVLKERAKKIADQLIIGAQNVARGVKRVTKSAIDELHELQRTAQSVSNAWSSTQAVAAIALIIGAIWYFSRRQ